MEIKKMEKFAIWKKEIMKKWNKSVSFKEEFYGYADTRAKEFSELIREKEDKGEREGWYKYGIQRGWKHIDSEGIKRGFRGDVWFRALVEDFDVRPYQPRIKEGVPWDLYIPLLGTVEVKTSKIGEPFIKIKTTFYKRPSLFLVGIKTCDITFQTFQFIGWLHGYEVYKLPLNREMPHEPCPTPLFKNLHRPNSFFNELIEISSKNPNKRCQ